MIITGLPFGAALIALTLVILAKPNWKRIKIGPLEIEFVDRADQ